MTSLLLSFAVATIWWRGRYRGAPVDVRLRSPFLLFLGVLFIYSLNGRALTAGDTIPASYLPLSLLREFDFDLNEFPFLYANEMPWFLQQVGDRIVSSYPPWAGVLALPVYLLPVLGGVSPQDPMIWELEKLSAATITALSVLVLLLALRRLTDEKTAWCVSVIYALGTSSFSSSSQALWQHGPGQLFLALTIYCLVRAVETPRFAAYAGMTLGLMVICRPSNAFMALPIAAYVLLRRRDQAARFCLASLPPAVAFLLYNTHYHGSPVSFGFAGLGLIDSGRLWDIGRHRFATPLFEGLAGVLASPGRGLFVYSPILLVSLIGIALVWRDPKQVLLKYLSVAVVPSVLLAAKWICWWGGGSYGPRLLADTTPILCLYLYPPLERARARWFFKGIIVGLAALSIGLHGVRVFGGGDWNAGPNVDRHPERLWSWAESPPVYYAKNLFLDASAELQTRLLSLPTSRDAPNKLDASYRLIDPAADGPLHPNGFVVRRLIVTNTGKAVWLNRTSGERGEVRLGWRWLNGERETGFASGGVLIGHDVLPGQTYEFIIDVPAPGEPGAYVLELGLVDTYVATFAERGVPPIEIALQVVGL